MNNGKYPSDRDISAKDVIKAYPLCAIDNFPWRAYLSSFEWFKDSKTLLITREELIRIDIPPRSVDNLEGRKSPRVIIVQSHVTNKWYPFILSEVKKDCVIFDKVDTKCPIDTLIIER